MRVDSGVTWIVVILLAAIATIIAVSINRDKRAVDQPLRCESVIVPVSGDLVTIAMRPLMVASLP